MSSRFISALGLGVVFVSPVVALYSVFALTILAGGGTAWWAFVIGLAGMMFIALGFAEVSSKWPLAGGLYQWSRTLVGASYGWFASWTYSWTLFIGIALACYVAASFVPIVLDTSPFTPTETFLARLAILAVLYPDQLRFAEGHQGLHRLSVAAEVIGSIGIGIVLIVFYRINPISTLFDSFGAGWGSGPDLWSGLAAAVSSSAGPSSRLRPPAISPRRSLTSAARRAEGDHRRARPRLAPSCSSPSLALILAMPDSAPSSPAR